MPANLDSYIRPSRWRRLRSAAHLGPRPLLLALLSPVSGQMTGLPLFLWHLFSAPETQLPVLRRVTRSARGTGPSRSPLAWCLSFQTGSLARLTLAQSRGLSGCPLLSGGKRRSESDNLPSSSAFLHLQPSEATMCQPSVSYLLLQSQLPQA